MKLTYDESADAAYLYFKEPSYLSVDYTYTCDPREVNGMINLDFDAEQKLVGIEVLFASSSLEQELFRHLQKSLKGGYIEVDGIGITKVTNDKKSDVALIYLRNPSLSTLDFTYTCDPEEVKGVIKLHFDSGSRLIGVEVADASKKLTKEFLDTAINIDE